MGVTKLIRKGNFSLMVMVDTRLQCTEDRMGSEVVKMAGISIPMSLTVKDKRKGTVELREVFLKVEKGSITFKY